MYSLTALVLRGCSAFPIQIIINSLLLYQKYVYIFKLRKKISFSQTTSNKRAILPQSQDSCRRALLIIISDIILCFGQFKIFINQNKFVFFIILMNSSSLISPSPSLSASSIISCSSSSFIVYPNSLDTRFKFFSDIFPVVSSSNSLNAFNIYYLGSLSDIFPVISSMKSANSMTPFPSRSTSEIIFLTSSFLGSKPRALMATFNSFESM